MSPELAEGLTDTIRRLRVLEERYATLHRKVQVNEQNSLLKHKKMESDIKRLSTEMKEIRDNFSEVRDSIRMLVKELQSAAKREEVEILKRYINLWEPLHFVTRNEVSKIIDEMLDEKQPGRKPQFTDRPQAPRREQNL